MNIKPYLYFTIPKLLVIKDIRLGILNKIIQFVIFLFVLINLFYFELHYEIETPSGYITSMWAETGHLYDKQRYYAHLLDENYNFSNTSQYKKSDFEYCNNFEHNYIYSLPFWDYRNISCINLPYSEMYEKGEQEFFFMTMFTENSISIQDCNDPNYVRALENYRNLLNGLNSNNDETINNTSDNSQSNYLTSSLNQELDINSDLNLNYLRDIYKDSNVHIPALSFNNIECKITDRLDGNCICQDYKNFYTVGEEEMYFVFDYKYVTSFQKGGNYADHTSRGVKTRVFDYQSNLVKEFNENENIKFFVKDWINMAHIDLSDFNEATKITELGDNIYNINHPRFRITGLEIVIKINCNNLIKDTKEEYGTTICDIIPEINEGWASKGSSITYLNYPDLNQEFVTSVYKDRYRYGLKFKFYVTGKIGKYSFNNMMNTIISGLVLIGTGATIIILIISNFCCSYTKKIMDESNESSHKIRFTNCKRCHVEEEQEEQDEQEKTNTDIIDIIKIIDNQNENHNKNINNNFNSNFNNNIIDNYQESTI